MQAEILVDARELEPPEPLEKVLDALAALRPGQHIRLLLHREPFPLYGILENLGHHHQSRPCPDGSHEILIEAAPAGGTRY